MVTFISADEERTYSTERVNKLDLQNGVIDIGNYFTILPISPPEYQRVHPTSASIKVVKGKLRIVFYIMDDWGEKYTLIITGAEMNNPEVQKEVKRK